MYVCIPDGKSEYALICLYQGFKTFPIFFTNNCDTILS